ncbi:acyl CoA binding protein-domain-containing protein [Scleroderma yunnanense]
MEQPVSPALSDAAAHLSRAPSLSRLANNTKLELYGLYKFLTIAPLPQTSRPSLFDMTGRAKWDAWSNTHKTYHDRRADAENRYLDIARELGWVPGAASSSGAQPDASSDEVWDDELDIKVSSSSNGGAGMGTFVSALVRPTTGDGETETLQKLAIDGDALEVSRFLEANPLMDINERDEFGYTALHLACDRGNSAVVKILLEHGGDPLLKDPDGLTVLELTEIAGHDKLSAFLQGASITVE